MIDETKSELYELSALVSRQSEILEGFADRRTLAGSDSEFVTAAEIESIDALADARFNALNVYITSLQKSLGRAFLFIDALVTVIDSEDKTVRKKTLENISKVSKSSKETMEFNELLLRGFNMGDEEARKTAQERFPKYFPDKGEAPTS